MSAELHLLQKSKTDFLPSVLNAIGQVLPGDKVLPLHQPVFVGNEWNYLKECLDTGWVSTAGPFVDRFENMLCEYTGSKYAVAVVNGTAALHIALQLAGVKPDDEVLVPDLTFVATANAIAYTGATPHFIDISRNTLGVDPKTLRAYLNEIGKTTNDGLISRVTGRRISALIAMHTFGHPLEIEELAAVASEYGLTLIEDAAESIGSFYRGKHTGLWGKLSTLSFNGNKTITTGGGGAILTQDESLARHAKHLTTTAKQLHQWSFYHDQVGYNYRLPNLNAALGLAQLEKLEYFVEQKRILAKRYADAFEGLDGVTFVQEPPHARSNYWLNALILDSTHSQYLEPLLQATNDKGIQTRPAWNLMHTLPMFTSSPKMPTPIAEQMVSSLICLPSSATL